MTDTDSDQADRQARRKHLADLILRMRRGELHPQGRDILAAVIKDELAYGDQARAQVAAVQAIAVVAATRHGHHHHALADALGWDHSIAWAKLLAEVGQRTRDLTAAKAGDAPWIKAYGEDLTDAETRATQQAELLGIAEQAGNRAETLRAEAVADNERLRAELAAARAENDGWSETMRNTDRLTTAETTALRASVGELRAEHERRRTAIATTLKRGPGADWYAVHAAAAEYVRRAERAEATLTAVREAVADAKACLGEEYGCTVDHRDIITNLLDNGPAALGDPQPATACVGHETDPSTCTCDCEGCKHNCAAHQPKPPAVCCVCGCPDVTYRNCNEQPFCCRCAACCDPPVPCEHGCQPPTEPEAEREPGWAPATCRRMDTRTCPPSGPCPGPCARFESDDPTPWEQPAEPVTGAAVATDSAGTIFTLPGGIKPAEPQQERRPNCRCTVTPAPPAVPDGAALWAAIRDHAANDTEWRREIMRRISNSIVIATAAAGPRNTR